MLEFTIIIGYLVITTVISFLALKYTKSAGDYFVAQGQLGILLIVAMLFAEVTAGAGTVGSAQTGRELGISAVWAKWGMAFGYILFSFVVGKFYYTVNRKFGVMSVPGAFSVLFDEKTRLAMIFLTVISYTITFSVQPKAVATIIAPLINSSVPFATWAIGLLFILIALLGGMKGIAWMNTVHCVIMYCGITIVAILAYNKVGGLEELSNQLPTSYFNFFQPNWMTAVAWIFSSVISMFTSSIAASMVFSAKSMRTMRIGIILASGLMVPFAIFTVGIGIIATKLTPDAPSAQALFAVSANLGPAFSIIINIALVAAIVSSAPTFLLFCATSLTRDFYLPFIRPSASEKEQVAVSRVILFLLGVIAIWFGNNATSILGSILGGLQIRSVASVLLLLALVFPRIDARAGFWTLAIGGVFSAVWYFLNSPFGIEPLWVSVGVSAPVLVILTITAKKAKSDGWLKYKKAAMELEEK